MQGVRAASLWVGSDHFKTKLLRHLKDLASSFMQSSSIGPTGQYIGTLLGQDAFQNLTHSEIFSTISLILFFYQFFSEYQFHLFLPVFSSFVLPVSTSFQ